MAKVDILNYISEENILRSTYDTDTNELDITDVPQNLNSVIILGSGGGGGITIDDLAQNIEPSGDIVLDDSINAIKNYAFSGKPITHCTGKNVKSLGMNAFIETTIQSIDDTNFPSLGTTTDSALALRLPTTCTSIKLSGNYISLASGYYAFRGCKGLITAEFPNAAKDVISTSAKEMGQYAFAECTNLQRVDCGFTTKISAYAFYNSPAVNEIILRNTSLVPLTNITAFNGSPFKNGGTGGTIYIPETLYDHLGDGTSLDYQNASNWSTVYGYGTITWAKIEGSIYE